MSDYDKMRESDNYDDDGVSDDEVVSSKPTTKEAYFDFYDDIKLTPKDDW